MTSDDARRRARDAERAKRYRARKRDAQSVTERDAERDGERDASVTNRDANRDVSRDAPPGVTTTTVGSRSSSRPEGVTRDVTVVYASRSGRDARTVTYGERVEALLLELRAVLDDLLDNEDEAEDRLARELGAVNGNGRGAYWPDDDERARVRGYLDQAHAGLPGRPNRKDLD